MQDYTDDYINFILKDESKSYTSIQRLIESIKKIYKNASVNFFKEDFCGKVIYVLTIHRWNKGKVNFIKKNNLMGSVAGICDTDHLFDSTITRSGKIYFDKTVSGIYSAYTINKVNDKVFYWTSRPSIKKVFYSNDKKLFVASSDPLLAALVTSDLKDTEIELDSNYLDSVLAFGFPMYDISPYINIFILEPENILSIDHNYHINISKIDYYNNILDFNDDNNDDDVETNKARDLSSTSSKFLNIAKKHSLDKNILLRLSGGKDSRCLLAMLNNLNEEYDLETRSAIADTEFEVSSLLAEMKGKKLVRSVPKLACDNNIEKSVEDTLIRTHGLGLAESHQSIYEGAKPIQKGQLLLMGHSHIQRGGFAKRMKNDIALSKNIIHSQCSIYVSKDIKSKYEEFIDDWLSSTYVKSHLELQYEFHVQFRASAYLTGHYIDYSNEAILAYPMVEQSFVNVCDNLDMFDKVSERVVFKMIEELDKSLNKIPLKDDRWTFEAHGKNELGSTSYVDRNPNNINVRHSYRDRSYISLNINELSKLREAIIGSNHYKNIHSKLSDEIVELLNSSTFKDDLEKSKAKMDYKSYDALRKQVWRIYVSIIWLRKNWLESIL